MFAEVGPSPPAHYSAAAADAAPADAARGARALRRRRSLTRCRPRKAVWRAARGARRRRSRMRIL
eukprot:5856731-Prymnesium_polylepis.1